MVGSGYDGVGSSLVLQLLQRIGVDDPTKVERDLKFMLHESETATIENGRLGSDRMPRRIPEAHFVRYMNALSGHDFTTALEELQRYFDFGVCKGGEADAGLVGVTTRAGDGLHAHYAILNLAVLHFHFGSVARLFYFCFYFNVRSVWLRMAVYFHVGSTGFYLFFRCNATGI